jgi:myo-inositol catabolism protein IolS
MCESINQFGLGCWALGSESYGLVGEETAKELIECAVNEGITFFDTAPLYGNGISETRLGNYLPKSHNLRIATKVGISNDSHKILRKRLESQHIIDSVNGSLRRLRSENIFLLQLHSPELHFESDELFSTLNLLQKSGKVSNIGISLKMPDFLPLQDKLFSWNSFQYNCSILDQRIAKFSDLVEVKNKLGIYMIARTPLNFGFLGNKAPDIINLPEKHHLQNWPQPQLQQWIRRREQVLDIIAPTGLSILEAALRFPLDRGLANMIIPGATNKHELLENLRLSRSPLPESLVNQLSSQIPDSVIASSPYTIQEN